MQVIILTSIGKKIGLGHVNRAKVISKISILKNAQISLFCYSPEKIPRKIQKKNSKIFFLNKIKIPTKLKKKYDLAIFDISNYFFVNNIPKTYKLIDHLSSITRNVVIIDGLKPYSLLIPKIMKKANFFIVPYLGANTRKYNNIKILSGAKYSILNEKYAKINYNSNCRFIASIILVSFGGSDLNELTLIFLKLLMKVNIEHQLTCNVIIGPFFSKKYISKLKKIKNSNFLKFFFIHNKINLFNLYKSSDIIVSSSGLTKYEIAASNTPMILFAKNTTGQIYDKEFLKTKLACSINASNSNQYNISKIKEMILNYSLRKKYALKAKKLIDGKGTERISIFLRKYI